MQSKVKSMLTTFSMTLANTVFANDSLRRLALKIAEKEAYNILLEKDGSHSS